jgi:hypothetical protein
MPDPRTILYAGTEFDPGSQDASEMLRAFFEPDDWAKMRTAIAASRSGEPSMSPLATWDTMSERVLQGLPGDDRDFVNAMMSHMGSIGRPATPRFSEVQELAGGPSPALTPNQVGGGGAVDDMWRTTMEKIEIGLEAGIIDEAEARESGWTPDWRSRPGPSPLGGGTSLAPPGTIR